KELTFHTVTGIGKKLRDIKDDTIREKVREKVVKGELDTPEKVVSAARREEGRRQAREDKRPPDLLDVIARWTRQIDNWTVQLDEVLPYLKYIDSEPDTAQKWRAAVQALVERLKKFL